MRTNNTKTILLLGLATTVAFAVMAQYSVEWWTVDGGGGTSTGGVYAVSGTIGQPDPGTMSGGNYSLQGGFWGVVAAIQSAGAPWLTVSRTPTNTVAVSWSNSDPNWKLHWTTNLRGTNTWNEVAPPYQTNGSNCLYCEPAPAGNKFYRLHKP